MPFAADQYFCCDASCGVGVGQKHIQQPACTHGLNSLLAPPELPLTPLSRLRSSSPKLETLVSVSQSEAPDRRKQKKEKKKRKKRKKAQAEAEAKKKQKMRKKKKAQDFQNQLQAESDMILYGYLFDPVYTRHSLQKQAEDEKQLKGH